MYFKIASFILLISHVGGCHRTHVVTKHMFLLNEQHNDDTHTVFFIKHNNVVRISFRFDFICAAHTQVVRVINILIDCKILFVRNSNIYLHNLGFFYCKYVIVIMLVVPIV